MAESLVTLRVPKEMKERMEKAGINWSEELRRAISVRLDANQKKNTEVELELVLESVKPGFNSLEAIKEARRHD